MLRETTTTNSPPLSKTVKKYNSKLNKKRTGKEDPNSLRKHQTIKMFPINHANKTRKRTKNQAAQVLPSKSKETQEKKKSMTKKTNKTRNLFIR